MRLASGPRYPPPIIVPAVRADVPELVRIMFDAKAPDLLSFFFLSNGGDLEDQIKKTTSMFNKSLDDPQQMVMKALDADTQEITACSVWNFKNFEAERYAESERRSAAQFMAGHPLPISLEGKSAPHPLEKYLLEKFNAFQDAWMKETKNFYLGLLMTDPKFQRRGIGTALLNWGHEIADKKGLPSFLVATPVGHPLYLSVGWKEVAEPITIDFREFVPGARSGDKGWGIYQYYFHLRLPKNGN